MSLWSFASVGYTSRRKVGRLAFRGTKGGVTQDLSCLELGFDNIRSLAKKDVVRFVHNNSIVYTLYPVHRLCIKNTATYNYTFSSRP